MGAHKAEETAGRTERQKSIGREVAEAITPRAALLIAGVLFLQLAFVASYIGAFHKPTPHRVPIAVVAPEPAQQELVRALNGLDGDPLDVKVTTTDRATAEQRLKQRKIDGALVVDPRGTTDTLLIATGGGSSAGQALEEVLGRVQEAERRELRTVDVVPAKPDDGRGLSAFYLVIGWCIGGYLGAAALAMSYGAHSSTVRRAAIRLVAMVAYAVIAGLGGTLVAGPLVGALPGSVLGLAAVGALTVFAVGAVTLALQSLAGTVGVGLAILLVVVVGNPSAGGAYATPLLPTFWREIGPYLPTGASTWSARSVAYFDGVAMSGPLLVLAVWALAGVVLTLLFTLRHRRRVQEKAQRPASAR